MGMLLLSKVKAILPVVGNSNGYLIAVEYLLRLELYRFLLIIIKRFGITQKLRASRCNGFQDVPRAESAVGNSFNILHSSWKECRYWYVYKKKITGFMSIHSALSSLPSLLTLFINVRASVSTLAQSQSLTPCQPRQTGNYSEIEREKLFSSTFVHFSNAVSFIAFYFLYPRLKI
jgi:hypothetical protein